ncbi:MAG TPA: branched-chain amino acid ABC transporter permease [Burkholderiales bacterium]|nr:branched-chain amino acid ABC transporter permease [Burkholderiales bacterium]
MRVLLGLALLGLLLFPLVGERFYVQYAARIMIMAIFAMSLDLLVGYTGLASLGHALFYGIAGYALVMASGGAAVSLWWSLPAAMLLSALAALAVGALVLRTSGIYFTMATLAIAQTAYFLVRDSKFFGGLDGYYLNASPLPRRYYLTLGIAAATYVLLRTIVRSAFGRVLAGIRENEPRMRSLGFPTLRYKLACFVLAGALAGLAGCLSALQDGVVRPEQLGWQRSAEALAMVILGGRGTLAGPALGAGAVMLLELAFWGGAGHG